MSFRIWTIFCVFAVVVAAFATFGPGGILAVIIVVAFWALIFYGSKRLSGPIGLPAVLAIVAAVLQAVLQSPRMASSQSDQCEDNLKQISLALKAYSDRFGSFPPAYSVDPNGNPLLSWRVSVLPLLVEEPPYRRFDLNKA